MKNTSGVSLSLLCFIAVLIVVVCDSRQTEWCLYLCKLSYGNDTTQVVNIFTLVSSLNHKWMCHGMLAASPPQWILEEDESELFMSVQTAQCSMQCRDRSTTCGCTLCASSLTKARMKFSCAFTNTVHTLEASKEISISCMSNLWRKIW